MSRRTDTGLCVGYPLLRSLIDEGYGGSFSVEYEGRHDGTLRLYRSVQRARAALGD